MKTFYTSDGKPSRHLSEKGIEKELQSLSVEHLIVVAKRKKGLKKALVEFLIGKTL
jgi:hypothetical protein